MDNFRPWLPGKKHGCPVLNDRLILFLPENGKEILFANQKTNLLACGRAEAIGWFFPYNIFSIIVHDRLQNRMGSFLALA